MHVTYHTSFNNRNLQIQMIYRYEDPHLLLVRRAELIEPLTQIRAPESPVFAHRLLGARKSSESKRPPRRPGSIRCLLRGGPSASGSTIRLQRRWHSHSRWGTTPFSWDPPATTPTSQDTTATTPRAEQPNSDDPRVVVLLVVSRKAPIIQLNGPVETPRK